MIGRLILAMALMLVAIGAEAQTPRRGGTLIVSIAAEPPTYDCHASQTFATIHAVAPSYSTLLRFDLDAYPRVVGDVAESWEVSGDGLTYRFRLREGIQFHDGSTLTSSDVKATYERLRSPPAGTVSVRQALFEDIAAIETPDPRSIVFRLKAVNVAMPEIFASPWNCLYSAARLAADPEYPTKKVMGTGPFRFVEHVRGSHWQAQRFDAYFRAGLPYLDGWRAVFFQNTTALLNALQGGQVMADFRGLTPSERDRLVQALGDQIRIEESPIVVMMMLAFNTSKPPFDDARVRRALTLAIDRRAGSQALARLVPQHLLGGLMRPGAPYALPDDALAQLPGFGRDIAAARAEARRLLAEAGRSNLSFTLINRNFASSFVPVGVFLIDQWRQIGVTVEHRPLETAPWSSALISGNFDVIMDASNEYSDEPALGLTKFLSSDRSPNNFSRRIDRELDRLYDLQRVASDVAQRKSLLADFQKRAIEDAATLPLFWQLRPVPMRPNVKGWKLSPSNLLGQDLAEVWLAP